MSARFGVAVVAAFGVATGGACDSLDEYPGIPAVEVTVLEPVPDSRLVQPGPTIPVTVEVTGCEEIEELVLFTGTTQLTVELTNAGGRGRFCGEIPAVSFYEEFPFGPAGEWYFTLEAEVSCADYGQRERSRWIGFTISPFAYLESLVGTIHHLEPGLAGGILAVTTENLSLAGPDRAAAVFNQGSVEVFGYAGDVLYVYAECGDVFCLNESGHVFAAWGADLSWHGIQRLTLDYPAEVIIGGPDPDQLLIFQDGGGWLTVSTLDLQTASATALPFVPVPPARHLADGSVRLLGLPSFSGATSLEVVTVTSGLTLERRPVALNLDRHDLWVVSEDGSRAAVLLTGDSELWRLTLDDGAIVGTDQLAIADSEWWLDLFFVGNGDLLALSNFQARQIEFATGETSWSRAPESFVDRAAPIAEGGILLRTQAKELWILDDNGDIIRDLGTLPNSWQVTSNLLASEDGWIFFGLEEELVGYEL